MYFKEETMAQYAYQERLKSILEMKVSQLPQGSLVQKTARGHRYYYAQIGNKLRSLRGHPELVEQYREKAETEKQILQIGQNLETLRAAIQQYVPLNTGCYGLNTVQGKNWDDVPAQQNTYKSDCRELVFRGIYYKSKSEMLIATMLVSYNIEFKYEVTLKHGYRKMYPDFVIRRPKDGKIFYWEHAGMTDNEDYVKDLHFKLDDYHAEKINLWDNLILTFDKPDGSLDMDYIDKVIKLYLL